MTTESKVGEMVPAAEAAVRLGISRETVVRRIQRGELLGVLREGRWMVAVPDLLAHAKSGDGGNQ